MGASSGVCFCGKKRSLVAFVMKSISYFLIWQKRKLSDKPVEAGEDYTKFNSADFARKVSVCEAVCLKRLNMTGIGGFDSCFIIICFDFN